MSRHRFATAVHAIRLLPTKSAHALVTDPPSGIVLHGLAWDTDKGGRDAWRLGRTARTAFDYFSAYDDGMTIRAGRIERADTLDILLAGWRGSPGAKKLASIAFSQAS